jgi:hypothetical protein
MPNDPGQEGRLELAIRAIRSGQITSVRRAVRLYDIPRSTLQRRLDGITQRSIAGRTKRKLTETEEYTLLQWILSMDKRGAPLRPTTVQNMANLLLANRDASKPSSTVGKNWVTKFVRRHDALKTRFSRRYDHQRALCEDPKKIQEWFELVRSTIKEWGIADEDIYNFDETGFAMGTIATARVITQAERTSRPSLVQPGNREWVTAIETINAAGWVLPPMVIFAGKTHRTNWFENTDLPLDWMIGVSENGWTNDQLGFEWLQSVFEPNTKDRTKGVYRLLILDGHNSHLTPRFDQFCTEHKIVPLCMPPHSSHILQPLDVGCFSVLKRSYGHQIENFMRLGIDHIDKSDFLISYKQARTETYKDETIRNGFKATGLVPYDPIQVLSKLNMITKTPTPPGSSHGSQSSHWTPKTPHNLRQLEHQTCTIEQHFRRRTMSSSSPTKQALGQLVKGCHLAMHNAILLADENTALRLANQKQRQKREKTVSSISQGGILTVQEGQTRTQSVRNVEGEGNRESVNEPKRRAPSRCSLCSSYEHTARTCAQRYSNNQ